MTLRRTLRKACKDMRDSMIATRNLGPTTSELPGDFKLSCKISLLKVGRFETRYELHDAQGTRISPAQDNAGYGVEFDADYFSGWAASYIERHHKGILTGHCLICDHYGEDCTGSKE